MSQTANSKRFHVRDKLRNTFDKINWGNDRKGIPRSGPGSTLEHTALLRKELPNLFQELDVMTFLDAPCGDWHWMQHTDLSDVSYIGLDIVPDIVAKNAQQFGSPTIAFDIADITSDPLPKADMMMCRDCLFHLKFWLRWAFFDNFLKSEIPWLLTTTYECPRNRNVPENGKFRYFNMELEPFSFPPPKLKIADEPGDGTELRFKRFLGLWHRDQILTQAKKSGA